MTPDEGIVVPAVPEERCDTGMASAGGASAYWRAHSHHRPVKHTRCAVR